MQNQGVNVIQKKFNLNLRLKLCLIIILFWFQGACVTAYRQSIGAEQQRVFNRIFLTDFNTAWQAVLDTVKSLRLDVSNREGGFLQTRWTENTAEKNFVDSYGGANAYLKAKYRLRINVSKGFYNGEPSVKVVIQKEQVVQRDVLDGWRSIETDGVDENTMLYRVGRVIYMRMKLAEMEEEKKKILLEKQQQEMENLE